MDNKEIIEYNSVKDWLYPNGDFIHQRALPRIIKGRFPVLFDKLSKGDFKVNLYMYLNHIIDIPKCGECDNKVNFKNFNIGFRKFCSNSCVGKHNKGNPVFKQKVSLGINKIYDQDYYLNKYENVISKDGEEFILADGTRINKNKHGRLKEFDIDDTIESFKIYHKKYSYKCSEEYIKDYFPNTYKEILKYTKLTKIFAQRKLMFLNEITEIPLCQVCNETKVNFSKSNQRFNYTCNKGSCKKASSKFEREVYSFVTYCTDLEVIPNYRYDNSEIDIYIPELNIGFECNGLYWHSELHKDKMYHQNKKLHFKEQGINVMSIWEDEWESKQELIKSMISNKLGLSVRIFGRKTEIRIVEKKDSIKFLKENHIQGNSTDTTRIGLYHENILVSLMTFGKRKYINSSTTTELIRFCNKQGHIVIGGASKLLNHFRKTYINEILSYANLDISNGNLYEKLGFVKTGFTPPGYFWTDFKTKQHRSNFMKHKLVEQGFDPNLTEVQIMHSRGYYRIWDCGNIKYTLIIK